MKSTTKLMLAISVILLLFIVFNTDVVQRNLFRDSYYTKVEIDIKEKISQIQHSLRLFVVPRKNSDDISRYEKMLIETYDKLNEVQKVRFNRVYIGYASIVQSKEYQGYVWIVRIVLFFITIFTVKLILDEKYDFSNRLYSWWDCQLHHHISDSAKERSIFFNTDYRLSFFAASVLFFKNSVQMIFALFIWAAIIFAVYGFFSSFFGE